MSTRSLPPDVDAVPAWLREVAHVPDVFAGGWAPGAHLCDGRYTVERLVGRGGMGSVYVAIDNALGTRIALKVALKSSDQDLRCLRNEVLLAQEVSHRNICRTHDLEDVEGHWAIKMEYIDGPTLAEMMVLAGRLSVETSCAIACQIAQGLHAMHERGVVHRDLKPSNILIEEDGGRVVLMDFGLACSDRRQRKAAGTVAGTPEFMAPEQALGQGVDGRTDLYALGCILYHMLTGFVVFPAETAMAAALRHARDPPPDPRALRPDIPAWLAELVLSLLQKDRTRRPADAARVAGALASGHRADGGPWIAHPDRGS